MGKLEKFDGNNEKFMKTWEENLENFKISKNFNKILIKLENFKEKSEIIGGIWWKIEGIFRQNLVKIDGKFQQNWLSIFMFPIPPYSMFTSRKLIQNRKRISIFLPVDSK